MPRLLFILAIFLPTFLFGQKEKQIIIESFDTIEYYSDSTIKGAYNIKNGLFNGNAIEFNTPDSYKVGKYKKGIRTGRWYYSNLWWTKYKKGEEGIIVATRYDNGQQRQNTEYYLKKLYSKAINSRKKTKRK